VQRLLICLLLICGFALAAPAAGLASGPSAGDQQYVDPLGGSSSGSHSSSHSSSPGTTSSPTPAPVASPPAATTATVASTTSTRSSTQTAGDPGTLPRTGFDVWPGVAVGIGLLASGAFLRRAARGG